MKKLLIALLLAAMPASAQIYTAAGMGTVFSTQSEKLEITPPSMFILHAGADGLPAITINLSPDSAMDFSSFTARHIGEALTMTMCSQEVLSAVLMVEITDGRILISNAQQAELALSFLENGCP